MTGLEIIKKIVAQKPVSSQYQNGSYNIYKDVDKKEYFNYVELSNKIVNLDFSAQPLAPDKRSRILWFDEDPEMKYD